MREYELVVIGGGPAGYTGAIRASQLGMKVACIEERGTLGGTCLNVGCIPSKALLQSTEAYYQAMNHFGELGVTFSGVGFDLGTMQKRKDQVVSSMARGIEGLFKKNNVDYLVGHGRLEGKNVVSVSGSSGTEQITAKRILIATGSSPIELPMAKFDEKHIVSSTGALVFADPPKHLVVVGGGVIGLELGSVWARLGSKVTIIEAMPAILAMMDEDVIRTMTKVVKKMGVEIHADTKFMGVSKKRSELTVSCEKASEKFDLVCDKLLIAVGRRAHTDKLGLENIGLDTQRNGKLTVDANYETKVPGVYAVGDVIDGAMLAHKAEEEAIACVEKIAGVAGHVNYQAIPSVVYTWPEVASVGLTEKECKDQGYAVKIGKFPFSANGRAKANGDTEGFVKVIADAKSDRLLGVHICGPHASEMIGEVVVGFEYAASSEDIARSVHAHPTLSEAIKEACLGVEKRTINM